MRPTPSSRGDRDDAATSAFFHARQKALDSKERRGKVSINGSTPSFFARIFERARGSKAPACVRNKDVYRSELTFYPKTSRLDLGKVRDIATDLHRTAACKLDFFSDGRYCCAIPSVNHDLGPLLRKGFGDCGSDAP
jgi:hypothetical protein